LYRRVATFHSNEPCPRKALTITPAPIRRTANPIQSEAVQTVRQRVIHADPQSRKRTARTNTIGTIESSPRTNGAIALARAAATTHQRLGAINTRRIRNRQSVAYGYASGSSTIIEE
jgi:hypothetical protein